MSRYIGWRIRAWERGYRAGVTRSSEFMRAMLGNDLRPTCRTLTEFHVLMAGFKHGMMQPATYEQIELYEPIIPERVYNDAVLTPRGGYSGGQRMLDIKGTFEVELDGKPYTIEGFEYRGRGIDSSDVTLVRCEAIMLLRPRDASVVVEVVDVRDDNMTVVLHNADDDDGVSVRDAVGYAPGIDDEPEGGA